MNGLCADIPASLIQVIYFGLDTPKLIPPALKTLAFKMAARGLPNASKWARAPYQNGNKVLELSVAFFPDFLNDPYYPLFRKDVKSFRKSAGSDPKLVAIVTPSVHYELQGGNLVEK